MEVEYSPTLVFLVLPPSDIAGLSADGLRMSMCELHFEASDEVSAESARVVPKDLSEKSVTCVKARCYASRTRSGTRA